MFTAALLLNMILALKTLMSLNQICALNEDVVLKILSTNILKDSQEIGNARININFGKLKEDDSACQT